MAETTFTASDGQVWCYDGAMPPTARWSRPGSNWRTYGPVLLTAKDYASAGSAMMEWERRAIEAERAR